jgi:hypothetical protein
VGVNQKAGALFRFMGGLARNMVIANTFGSFALLIFMVLGGFIITRGTDKHIINNLIFFSTT